MLRDCESLEEYLHSQRFCKSLIKALLEVDTKDKHEAKLGIELKQGDSVYIDDLILKLKEMYGTKGTYWILTKAFTISLSYLSSVAELEWFEEEHGSIENALMEYIVKGVEKDD